MHSSPVPNDGCRVSPLSTTPDPLWQALVTDAAMGALAGPAWYRSLADAWDTPIEVHTLNRAGRLVAALPLVRRGGWHRRWTSVTNDYVPSCAYPFVADVEGAVTLLDGLLDGVDSLTLARIPQDGALCRALEAAAMRRGLTTTFVPEGTDCVLRLDAPWPEVRKRLSTSNSKENERKRRQLEKHAPVRFDAIHGGDAVSGVVDEWLALEAKGWKGADGVPILRDPQALRFYRGLTERAAADGTLALYTLRLGGELIACEYALRAPHRIDVLKIAYDEAWAKQSPGGILRLAVFEHELARGFRGTYHIGTLSEWKRRWSPEVRPLCSLQIYAGTARGRAAWAAGPLLRETLDASPRLRQAAIRTRDLARRLTSRFA